MNYLTVYLHAATQPELNQALAQVLPLDDEGAVITGSHDHHLAWLPELRRPTGVMLTDEEGLEYPETEPVPGAHANLRTRHQSVVEALIAAGVVITPATPLVVFA
ncbi:hypothetical protein HNR62_001030 [Oceanisphaera litoralis]|uniref:hypothetical protein n=1 Tax=Oceanisphaera litoralis TaxID=225144 RepID=UPI00195CBF0F|nr:hypothetical protein [Oceanisphaera litoralis]MBM7455170.1 hypothetical protein [Oceanisphaera litoralis]